MHVQRTCKCFAHFELRTHLQVKREAAPIPNSQVTRIPPQLECLSAVPVGRRLHAPEAESFFDMGSSGFRKL